MMRAKQLYCTIRLLLAVSILFFSAGAHSVRAQLAAETEARIRAVLLSPQLQDAHIGLSILDLGAVRNPSQFPAENSAKEPFRVLFEKDAHKKFMPASNMKLFTAAIALQLLGSKKTFPTRVFQHEQQLRLFGGGDPSLKVADLEKLADQIAAYKVGAIGGVVGDGSLFSGESHEGKFPYGWTVDDTLWYYGPAISALAIERNHFDLVVNGGAAAGSPAHLEAGSPLAAVFQVKGTVFTREQAKADALEFSWNQEHTLSVSGETPAGKTSRLGVAFPDPPQFAAAALEKALQRRGILKTVKTGAQSTLASGSQSTLGQAEDLILPLEQEKIAEHQSPPLKVLLRRLLKNSDNLYAEMLLRNAAVYHDGTGGKQAGARAHQLLEEWLKTQSIDPSALRFEDGSGLSRYNLLTPRATSELLASINKMPEGDAIWDALPIAGVDGTLGNRLKNTLAEGNVRAKTGTFSITSNLSGYVTTRDNRRLAVSVYINFARDTRTMRWAQDAIFTALAESHF